ncbi:radical SAM protein [Photobacterium kasasachensis]|uniref:radical SAM protein n=1 Tax=Photobacterium kasasachensis TaxID=2910240 RepID=UPI003D0D57DA
MKNSQKDISSNDLNLSDLIKLSSVNYKVLASHILGKMPKEKVLSQEEIKLFNEIKNTDFPSKPINGRKIVSILKVTRRCNLRCKYCVSWSDEKNMTMSFKTMLTAVKRILSIPNINRFEFVWHGGEVSLLKPVFFKKLIWIQENLKRPEQQISNSIQSNAVDISDEWLTFIKGVGLSVGISLDGPPSINDNRRIDFKGRGTSTRIINSTKRMREKGIDYGTLVVVDREVMEASIEEMFDFFVSAKLTGIDFLNYVPDNTLSEREKPDHRFISYKEYVSYLSKVFRIWWKNYKDIISIPLFTDIIQNISQPGSGHSQCYWDLQCSQEIITIEPNGDITPCDKYIGDSGSIYGSLLKHDLATLFEKSAHNNSMISEEKIAIEKMKACEWFKFCNGGCSHDRLMGRRHSKNHDDTCCGSKILFETVAEFL